MPAVVSLIVKRGVYPTSCSRSQQINEALVSVPGCRTVNAERSSLELPVVASDGSQLVVRVTLVPSFPRSAPVIVVSPPIRHPWVDVSGSVSPPSLFSWGQNKNVRLSSVLQQVRDELAQRLRPTSQLQQPTPSSAVRPGSAPGMVPEVPQQFAGLSRVPTDQLMQALSDPAAYKSLLDWMEGQLHLSKVQLVFCCVHRSVAGKAGEKSTLFIINLK